MAAYEGQPGTSEGAGLSHLSDTRRDGHSLRHSLNRHENLMEKSRAARGLLIVLRVIPLVGENPIRCLLLRRHQVLRRQELGLVVDVRRKRLCQRLRWRRQPLRQLRCLRHRRIRIRRSRIFLIV